MPGYPGSGTPTNYYPGLVPQDFHLQTVSGGYKNWSSIGDPYGASCRWCKTSRCSGCATWRRSRARQLEFWLQHWQHQRPSRIYPVSGPHGFVYGHQRSLLARTIGGSVASVRRPRPACGGRCHDYLCREVAWTLYTTKCDGFRLDAVKHVPATFFWSETGHPFLIDR